jgi:uroporphyrinogen-III synthase
MSRQILITQERSKPISDILVSHGVPYIHIPIFSYRGLKDQDQTPLPNIVLVTSARTFQYCSNTEFWANKKVYVIGQKTAEAARQYGVCPEFVGQLGGRALVEKAQKDNPDRTLLHIGGRALAEPVKKALAQVPHVRRIVYEQIRNPRILDLKVAPTVVTLSSPNSAELLSQNKTFEDVPCICIGQTTARHAHKCGLKVHSIASHMTLESLGQATVSAWYSL